MPNTRKRGEILIFEGEAKAVLPAAESFARRGLRVVVASSRRYCLGFYTRFCRERILMPNQSTEPDQCRDFLLDLVERRRFEMILPLGDEVTQIVCQAREEFLKHTRLVLVPYETFMVFRDKVRTMRAAEQWGVPVPRTFDPQDTDLDEIHRQVEYPVLVKPAFSNGARGIRYAHDKDELLRNYELTARDFGRTFIQEFIPHTGTQYKTELLLDRDGTVLGSFAYAKLRFYPPTGGSSTFNKSLYYPEMVEHAMRLARGVGWYGMADFDFIYDPRDQKPKLMEVNPRVTDTIKIANLAGLDFFEMLHAMAFGRKVEPVHHYRPNLYMRFLPGEIMWFLTAKGQRRQACPGFFRFFGPDVKYLITSASDPGPIMAYVVENLIALFDPRQRAYKLRTQSLGHV